MKKIAFIAATLLFMVAFAQAQPRAVFKDGPHFAYPTGGDVRNERAGYGWQVAYEWNHYVSMEASITRQKDKIDDMPLWPALSDSEFDLEIINIAVSGRLSYPLGPLTPYLGGGLGYYYMRTDTKGINQTLRENPGTLPPGVSELRIGADMDNTFGYHVAAGLELLLTPSWEVFAEYRRVFLDSDITVRRTESRPTPGATLAFERMQTQQTETFPYDHGLIRVGVNYRF